MLVAELTPDRARSALAQIVDMPRVLYQSGLSHRNLHMHRLMVYRNKGDSNLITMKGIDFGKSKFSDGVKG
jgi:hypothetical protein